MSDFSNELEFRTVLVAASAGIQIRLNWFLNGCTVVSVDGPIGSFTFDISPPILFCVLRFLILFYRLLAARDLFVIVFALPWPAAISNDRLRVTWMTHIFFVESCITVLQIYLSISVWTLYTERHGLVEIYTSEGRAIKPCALHHGIGALFDNSRSFENYLSYSSVLQSTIMSV